MVAGISSLMVLASACARGDLDVREADLVFRDLSALPASLYRTLYCGVYLQDEQPFSGSDEGDGSIRCTASQYPSDLDFEADGKDTAISGKLGSGRLWFGESLRIDGAVSVDGKD